MSHLEEARWGWRPPDWIVSQFPGLRALRAVPVPGARFEITEFLILHLIEFGVELDELAIGAAVEDRKVVARPEPHRPISERDAVLRQVITGIAEMGRILQLEGHMVHPRGIAPQKVHRVMIRITSHEHEEIFQPIGDAKLKYRFVELGERRWICREKGDMAELDGADP
jgi:hypothetical protein